MSPNDDFTVRDDQALERYFVARGLPVAIGSAASQDWWLRGSPWHGVRPITT